MSSSHQLPKVKECISYVCSLGYKFVHRNRLVGSNITYYFEIIDKSKRPAHNWEMTWTLTEMRHAVKYGC